MPIPDIPSQFSIAKTIGSNTLLFKITHNFLMQFTKYNNFLSTFDLILYPSHGNLTTHIAISCVFLVGNELVTIFCRIRANKGAARIAPRGFKIRRRRSHRQNFGAIHIIYISRHIYFYVCLFEWTSSEKDK